MAYDGNQMDELNDKEQMDNRADRSRQAGHDREPVTASSDRPGTNGKNPSLVTIADPESPVAEEYRNVKAMIVRMTQQQGFQNTLLVTSSLSGEGKSVSAVNLAVTLSQEYDHTVLLVDADLRHPTLHKYLNVWTESGLSDCLENGLDVADAITKTGIDKLSLLPAGKGSDRPAELLSSGRMKDICAEIKSRYRDRYIIIDTPPVLPFAETRSLSSFVDGVIFVVRQGIASLHSIQEALDVLKKGTVLGILYNAVSREHLNGHHHYYYEYYRDRLKGRGEKVT